MPVAPNTWAVLQAIQWHIQNEVLVGGVSPFSLWNPATNHQTKYGTNPNSPTGTIPNAIYIGAPKDWQSGNAYPNVCTIIPPMYEMVARHALNGKIWDEGDIIVLFSFQRKDDWYSAMQKLIAARDAMYPMLGQHAELPGAPTVVAGNIKHGTGAVGGYNVMNIIGEDWDTWGFTWWIRQEYFITGGVTN